MGNKIKDFINKYAGVISVSWIVFLAVLAVTDPPFIQTTVFRVICIIVFITGIIHVIKNTRGL